MNAIHVEFLGAGGETVVYLETSNDATLRLSNLTGAPIAISTSTFKIVLSLTQLFASGEESDEVVIEASGWTAAFVTNPTSKLSAWELTPSSNLQWEEGAELSFAISSLTPTVPAGLHDISVTIYGYVIPPYYVTIPVGVEVPDSGPGDLETTFGVDLSPHLVYGTKSSQQVIENTLEVTFVNTSSTSPLVTEPWTVPPQFTISFVYSNSPRSFALTTESNAVAFEVGMSQGTGWQPPIRLDSPTGPKWLMQPDPQNQEVLGIGEASLVSFSISNIITEAAPGPTQMYVEWHGVPGYQDANLSVIFYKDYLPVSIAYFNANETAIPPGGKVYLDWLVENAMLVELSGVGAVDRQAAGYEVELWETTTIVLTAYDPITGGIDTRNVSVTVAPPVGIDALAKDSILMWHGDPAQLPSGFRLCDGADGTPDLRDRFILAAGTTVVGATGEGSHDHELPGTTLTDVPTTQAGVHSHEMPSGWHREDFDEPGAFNIGRTGIDIGGYNKWGQPTESAGEHQHKVNVTRPLLRSGPNTALRPKWYALMYVMQK